MGVGRGELFLLIAMVGCARGDDAGTPAADSARTAALAAGHTPAGRWVASESTDPITDVQIADAALFSEAATGPATLLLRCQGGLFEVAILWPEYLGTRNQIVTWRHGRETPQSAVWSISTNGRGVFFIGDGHELVDKLTAEPRLAVEITTDRGRAVHTFDATGVEAATARLHVECPAPTAEDRARMRETARGKATRDSLSRIAAAKARRDAEYRELRAQQLADSAGDWSGEFIGWRSRGSLYSNKCARYLRIPPDERVHFKSYQAAMDRRFAIKVVEGCQGN